MSTTQPNNQEREVRPSSWDCPSCGKHEVYDTTPDLGTLCCRACGQPFQPRIPRPVGAYAFSRRVGNLLFLAGLGPRDPLTNEVPGNVLDERGIVIRHDIVAQTHAVFRNVRAVLEQAGARWENLVDVTVFLTDLPNDFAAFNQLWAEYFPSNPPTRTTVEVSRLPTPIAVELKAIAMLEETK